MKKRTIDLDFAKRLYNEPENFIDSFDLVYATDRILNIERLRDKDQFVYVYKKKPITSKKVISRIDKLVIPPAWQDVRIASKDNAHIQAIGRDEKGRKQYKYHSNWSLLRNRTKFYKMYTFGMRLPKLRSRVEQDLESKVWNKSKVLALILRLLEETHIRIGNSYYAKNNHTYGLSTLRSKHLDIYKDRLKFEFIGKRGKEHSVTLRNKKLIRLVQQCEEIPGWELFKYFDKHGEKHVVDSTMVNDYIHDISGELFTAKDFRTWGASKICFETLKELGIAKDESVAQKNILKAIDTASHALGNTRNVLRKYYVHPMINESYLDGSIEPFFSYHNSEQNEGLAASESSMLNLIETYKPVV
ncbi:DNA topoisomerase IB [Winogradskyella luteola]|uniref:DNA topoisomerase IB n=1 Tax=Winogradskyella luteola TaxID=2828330 RepID=A0A9X1F656_9FLAO|nr:DNA topoisomerase IB [Winogradskyella luteola]MBV7267846.1 DNA topoisomerase IB [Winogradskyella luteola]